MPRAAPLLLLLLLALAQRLACLPGPGTAAPPGRDPCLSQPCRNNGTCSPVPARGPAAPRRLQLLLPQPPAAYSCACPAGVTGASCQVRGAPTAPCAPTSAPPGAPPPQRPPPAPCPCARPCPWVSPLALRLAPSRPRSAAPHPVCGRLFPPYLAPHRAAPVPVRRPVRPGRRAAAGARSPPRAAAPSRRLLARRPLVPLTAAAGGLGSPRLSARLTGLRAGGRVKRLPALRATGLEPCLALAPDPRREP